MNRKRKYTDLERYKRTKRKQQYRYYEKTATHKSVPWTEEQEEIVWRHDMTDHEISKMIGHSVHAIQVRRSKIKKEKMKNE